MKIINEEYMSLSKKERQKHLKLDEPCKERILKTQYQNSGYSYYLKGLLADHLDTNIPLKNHDNIPVVIAHACNNPKCANPNHLYWGTYKENLHDSGTSHERKVAKYGEEGANKRYSTASKKSVKTCKKKYGSNYYAEINDRKGKPKTEEHKKNISQGLKGNKNRKGKTKKI
tara:strand:+ start:39 stop:554 length:516 start_codon:yes stop_codon:yes gene_type:complete